MKYVIPGLLFIFSIHASAATVSLGDILNNLNDTLTVSPVEYQGTRVVSSWNYGNQTNDLSSAEAICSLAGYKFVASVETSEWFVPKENLTAFRTGTATRVFENYQVGSGFAVKVLTKLICKR